MATEGFVRWVLSPVAQQALEDRLLGVEAVFGLVEDDAALAVQDLAGDLLAPNGESPRDWRFTVRDRSTARAALERILAWDIERVLLSHGICIERGGHAFVERAFAWLRK